MVLLGIDRIKEYDNHKNNKSVNEQVLDISAVNIEILAGGGVCVLLDLYPQQMHSVISDPQKREADPAVGKIIELFLPRDLPVIILAEKVHHKGKYRIA